MTPSELRRLADRKTADASDCEADAARIRQQAAALRGLLDPLIPMSQRVWTGPAAEDFERQVRVQGGLLEEEADRLLSVASDLERRAIGLRAEVADLRVRAANAEVVATGVPGVA